jgi:hypothetical protein
MADRRASTEVIEQVRTVLRRNEALHGSWQKAKRSRVLHPVYLRRAEHRIERSADEVLRDRAEVDNVLSSVHHALTVDGLIGHWHLYGGALLGWARQGRMLDHDLHDIDIAVDEEALPELLDVIDSLCLDGFDVDRVFVSNDGSVREVALRYGEVRVDLFVFRSVQGFWDNRGYGDRHGRPSELVSMLPRQPLETVRLNGLMWPKVERHEVELETIYGDWQTPDPTWKFGDDRSVVRTELWTMHDVSVSVGMLALRAQVDDIRAVREPKPLELRVRQ